MVCRLGDRKYDRDTDRVKLLILSVIFEGFFDQELSHIFDRKVKRLMNRGPAVSTSMIASKPSPFSDDCQVSIGFRAG